MKNFNKGIMPASTYADGWNISQIFTHIQDDAYHSLVNDKGFDNEITRNMFSEELGYIYLPGIDWYIKTPEDFNQELINLIYGI